MVLMAVITFLVCELMLNLLLANGMLRMVHPMANRSLVSAPIARFSPTSGYKLLEGEFVRARFIQGETVFHARFRNNAQGFGSRRTYNEKKSSSDVKRYMVLGDSMSAGQMHRISWVDFAHDRLAKLHPESKIELYSFSLGGIGLANWHSIFFKEILPRYEFDGVVIASYVDNYGRPLKTWHFEGDLGILARLDRLPSTVEEFQREIYPDLYRRAQFVFWSDQSAEEIDKLARYFAGDDSAYEYQSVIGGTLLNYYRTASARGWAYLLARASRLVGVVDADQAVPVSRGDMRLEGLTSDTILDRLDEKYPEEHVEMFREIVAALKEQSKELILASIPSRRQLVALNARGEASSHDDEVRILASATQASYFSGYQAFEGASESEIVNDYWFKWDGHWNMEGAELFGANFADFLAQHLELKSP